MECPKCGGNLVEDVLEDIEIKKDGIYIDVLRGDGSHVTLYQHPTSAASKVDITRPKPPPPHRDFVANPFG